MIHVHEDAVADLREVQRLRPKVFGRLMALIEQLRADFELSGKLLEHNFGSGQDEDISVSIWHNITRVERVQVWRLKAWDLEQRGMRYRLIYLYRWRDQSYTILAVVPRGRIDYDDPNHPLRQRISRRIRTEFCDA